MPFVRNKTVRPRQSGEHLVFRSIASMLGLPTVPAGLDDLIRACSADPACPLRVSPAEFQVLSVKLPVVGFMLSRKLRQSPPMEGFREELSEAAACGQIVVLHDEVQRGTGEDTLWALFVGDGRTLEDHRRIVDRLVLEPSEVECDSVFGSTLTARVETDSGPLFVTAVRFMDLIKR